MSFFSRVLSHFVNQVLVESLANSRTFQRFAVRSNAWAQDAGKKAAEQRLKLQQQAEEMAKWWSEHPSATTEEAEKARKNLPRRK